MDHLSPFAAFLPSSPPRRTGAAAVLARVVRAFRFGEREWKPIRSAPRDGTAVRVIAKPGNFEAWTLASDGAAGCDVCVARWIDDGYDAGFWGRTPADAVAARRLACPIVPTHWQPVPRA